MAAPCACLPPALLWGMGGRAPGGGARRARASHALTGRSLQRYCSPAEYAHYSNPGPDRKLDRKGFTLQLHGFRYRVLQKQAVVSSYLLILHDSCTVLICCVVFSAAASPLSRLQSPHRHLTPTPRRTTSPRRPSALIEQATYGGLRCSTTNPPSTTWRRLLRSVREERLRTCVLGERLATGSMCHREHVGLRGRWTG